MLGVRASTVQTATIWLEMPHMVQTMVVVVGKKSFFVQTGLVFKVI